MDTFFMWIVWGVVAVVVIGCVRFLAIDVREMRRLRDRLSAPEFVDSEVPEGQDPATRLSP